MHRKRRIIWQHDEPWNNRKPQHNRNQCDASEPGLLIDTFAGLLDKNDAKDCIKRKTGKILYQTKLLKEFLIGFL